MPNAPRFADRKWPRRVVTPGSILLNEAGSTRPGTAPAKGPGRPSGHAPLPAVRHTSGCPAGQGSDTGKQHAGERALPTTRLRTWPSPRASQVASAPATLGPALRRATPAALGPAPQA